VNLNWNDLLTALALVLIIEGILPFLAPAKLKEVYQSVQEMPEKSLRRMGFGSMVVGLILLFLI